MSWVKIVAIGCLCFSVVSAQSAEIDRTKLPGPASETQWTPPTVDVWKLRNGLSVWHVQQRHTPLVSVALMMPRGAETDPIEKAGRASVMVDMLDEAAGTRSALALSDEMQRLAMSFSGTSSTDSTTLSMNILAEKLDESLAVFTDILLRPQFQTTDFERRKKQRIASAIASEANLSSAAFRAMANALHGDGYIGLPSSGTKESLARLTLTDIKAAYDALISPQQSTLLVVGDVDKYRLEAALEKAGLDQWNPNTVLPTPRAHTPRNDKALHVIDFPGSSQSFILMARHAGTANAPDRYAAKVANHKFAGSFMSRLNLNLREDKGYTYGARGDYTRRRNAGSYVMYAKVKGDKTRASLDEMRAELRAVVNDRPIAQKERDEAVTSLLKGFPGQFERGSGLLNKLLGLAVIGKVPSELQSWPANIESVTLAAARKAVQTYMQLDSFAIVIAGDWSKIKASLSDLNLPVIMHQPNGQRVAGE